MLFNQIFYICLLYYWILAYSCLIALPSRLIRNNSLLDYFKEQGQTFSNLILKYGFQPELYLAKSDENIKEKLNENPELIDIIVSNHVSTIDFLLILGYLSKFNISSYNFVLKNEITYIPGMGLIAYICPDIKLSRNWEQDRDNITNQLDEIIQINRNGKSIILIFPEGTRFSQEKLTQAQEFSSKNNLPTYDKLLVPKTKGLNLIINHLKQKNKLGRIWDCSLIIQKSFGKSAFLTDLIGKPVGPVFGIFRELKTDFLNKDLPDSEKFKEWFLKNWKLKDNIIQLYENFIYEKIELEIDYLNILMISLIIILFTKLLFNEYGRYYIIAAIIISYLLIILKI